MGRWRLVAKTFSLECTCVCVCGKGGGGEEDTHTLNLEICSQYIYKYIL